MFGAVGPRPRSARFAPCKIFAAELIFISCLLFTYLVLSKHEFYATELGTSREVWTAVYTTCAIKVETEQTVKSFSEGVKLQLENLHVNYSLVQIHFFIGSVIGSSFAPVFSSCLIKFMYVLGCCGAKGVRLVPVFGAASVRGVDAVRDVRQLWC